MAFQFNNPGYLFLFIPILIFLIFILWKEFVKPQTQEEKELFRKTKKQRKWEKIFLGISRGIIILCLIIALSDPFLIQQVTIKGDQTLKILYDTSKSFSVFDTSIGENLNNELKEHIPTQFIPIGSEKISNIGDAILQHLEGNDNILLISDGNNNEGKSLGDLILFAGSLGATMYTLDLEPEKHDSRVVIFGPEKTVAGVTNTFYVNVHSTDGKSKSVIVTVDGETVFQEEVLGDRIFKKSFSQGYHNIEAKIETSDTFPENNVFRKSVQVLKKPKVAFVSTEPSPVEAILKDLYDLTVFPSFPETYDEYYAMILNDLASIPNEQVDELSEYVTDGNGLIVIGGTKSFDRGNYKGTYLETLLPVKVGTGEFQNATVNIVILIDVSGSTGATMESGSKQVDVEKAQAISIIEDLQFDDYVGVLAFNVAPHLVQPLKQLKDERLGMIEKIYTLQNGGGTMIAPAVAKATSMLLHSKGTKNIVIISDGKTTGVNNVIDEIKRAADVGIATYAVGIGETTRIENMRSFAEVGGGAFFQPGETQRLRVIFGLPKDDRGEVTTFGLFNAAPDHFITQGTDIMNVSIAGYNQVIPKSASKVIVSTTNSNPIITVWRFGLGRVIAVSTDDGSRYAGPLLSPKNSQLLVRTINWGIGSLNRKDTYYVNARDTYAEDVMEIIVKSPQKPKDDKFPLSKIDQDLYAGSYIPKDPGFIKILDRTIAVNYPEEFRDIGINPKLRELVEVTGGKVFKKDDINSIINSIKMNAQRMETKKVHYQWPFIIAALLLFLIEVTIRRMREHKKIRER